MEKKIRYFKTYEIEDLKDFAADNAALIWEMAREASYLRTKRESLNSGISILEYEFLASVWCLTGAFFFTPKFSERFSKKLLKSSQFI